MALVAVKLRQVFQSWSIQNWVICLLSACFFAIPLSTSAQSIFMLTTLSLIVLSPEYRQSILSLLSSAWCKAAFSLFLVVVVASLWSPASLHERWVIIGKYNKLLYLPIFVAGFMNKRARWFGMHAYLLAMLFTCAVSMAWLLGLLVLPNVEGGGIFRNHIMTGYMMAFAAYLAVFLLLKSSKMGEKMAYLSLAIVFTYHVFFINDGRTGYVMYVLLMGLMILQNLSWVKAWVGMCLGGALLVLSYYQSPVMHDAIGKAVKDYQLYQLNQKDTNIGYRLQFHEYAYTLFKRSPWIGNGTSSFSYTFHQENPIPARGDKLFEPHSQYWLMASEYGLLGVIAFAVFLGSLLRKSLQLKELKPIALAFLLSFMVGNLSDSLLLYSATGCFFIMFMALCFGERDEA